MEKMTQTIEAVSTRARTWQEEAEMLLSLLDCVFLDREAVYASSEFTTGKRFYKLCRQYDVRSAEELRTRLGDKYVSLLLTPNKEEGIRFARELRTLGHPLVLTPNPFHADPLNLKRNWSQPEYLDFWKMVIQRKCCAVCFNQGWEFSNGCTFEYIAGLEAGAQLFDHRYKPLKPELARDTVAYAIEMLEKEGFSVPKLREALAKLTSFIP